VPKAQIQPRFVHPERRELVEVVAKGADENLSRSLAIRRTRSGRPCPMPSRNGVLGDDAEELVAEVVHGEP
jgi:hypothetical protein